MNQLLEEYQWNVVAAKTGQYEVLSRNRWAQVFLLMAKEVRRLQEESDKLRAVLDVLFVSDMPTSMVDAYLRFEGLDQEEIGKRGAEFAHEALRRAKERNHETPQ